VPARVTEVINRTEVARCHPDGKPRFSDGFQLLVCSSKLRWKDRLADNRGEGGNKGAQVLCSIF